MKKQLFKGLDKAAKEFIPFKVISFITDPGYGYSHVKLLLIKFKDDKEFGLCIYDVDKQLFISEPGTLDDYNLTLERLFDKYPGLKNKF